MASKAELDELYQLYFGRDVDSGGQRTYRNWSVADMHEELSGSEEHLAYQQTQKYQDIQAEYTEQGRETAKDYWSGVHSEFKVEGKGLDMSPHDSAAYSYYASERIDQGLDDMEFGTFATADAIEDVEQRFLDEV